MTARRPLRAAIVGAGLMGRWHADAIGRAGGVVAAVVDATPGRAAQLAGRSAARAAVSLTEVLPDVDVVHVCTPTASHESLTREALCAGRHVLVEKPLAGDAQVTAALLDEAGRQGVLLCPVHQFPFQRGARQVFGSLERLGSLRHVDFVTCSAGAMRPGVDADAVAFEILPHPLSLLARACPAALVSDWAVRRSAAGEWRLTTAANGVSVSLLVSMSGRPTVNALRLIADRGTAHLDLFHGYAVVEPAAVSRLHKIAHPLALATATTVAAAGNLAVRIARREPAYPGLRPLVDAFYLAAANGGTAPIAADECLRISIAVDAIRAAARKPQ